MKRLIFLLVCGSIALCGASSLAARVGGHPMPEALSASESETLAYVWELHKYQGHRFTGAADCWDVPLLFTMADEEKLQMGIFGALLTEHGIPLPSDSEDYWSYSEGFLTEHFGIMLYVCWANPPMIMEDSAYIEEVEIRDLWTAIDGTSEQSLVDAYTGALLSAYGHLRRLAAMLGDPADYVAQVLSQADVDAILEGDIPPPGEAFAINATLNDTWYYPATDGQGFFITVYPDRSELMVGWFTYDTELPDESSAHLGHSCQRWLTAQGPYSGNRAELTVFSSSGGLFDTFTPNLHHEPIGSLELQFDDCNAGTVTYSLPGIDAFGVIPIERIALDNLAACESQYPQTE